jgi:hypothetical protein
MWINIEDYISYNKENRNLPPTAGQLAFKGVIGFLRSDPRCGNSGLSGGGARLHYGKAGWPVPGCWHGDKELPGTWCDFGCAKQQLDPSHK